MRVLRTLDGITYWTLEDPAEIAELVNVHVRKEWESDSMFEGKDPKRSRWLLSLSSRQWRLEVVSMQEIKLSQEIMNYSDKKTGYDFRAHLRERERELREEIEEDGAIIWPVILRHEDRQLVDGYCRYFALKNMDIKSTYAYIG